MERVKGIEPSSSAWEAGALPLCYTRRMFVIYSTLFIFQVNILFFFNIFKWRILRKALIFQNKRVYYLLFKRRKKSVQNLKYQRKEGPDNESNH